MKFLDADSAGHRLEAIIKAERRRIGHELHDQLGHLLVGALMHLRRVSDDDLSGGAQQAFKIAVRALERGAQATRNIVSGLTEEHGDGQDFETAVADLCARAELLAGHPVKLRMSSICGRASQELRVAIYRIVEEALLNIARHANARLARVEVVWADSVVDIDVIDDGCGGSDYAGGYGLAGVFWRAERAGGIASVLPRAEGGTRVTVRLPCSHSE